MGALASLSYNNHITQDTPIAGSSAGGIAVAAHACGIDPRRVLDSTIEISDECLELGGTQGRLLPQLRGKLNEIILEQEFGQLQERPGEVVVAYREVFPNFRSMHQTDFANREDLVNAICHSSSFPFFTTNWPVALDTSQRIPRLVVDGFFAVPRGRFGCPDFEKAGVSVDRTVCISVFPQEKIKLDACAAEDCISPLVEDGSQMETLLRLAMQSSSRKELTKIYEAGWEDAERWSRQHATVADVKGSHDVEAVESLN
jgi:hypothetical protein